jgi:hypothetical protein
MGAIRGLRDDDRYRWICKQQDAEDVLLIQEVLTLVINEWGQETGIFIPAFLKYGEPGNLAVC